MVAGRGSSLQAFMVELLFGFKTSSSVAKSNSLNRDRQVGLDRPGEWTSLFSLVQALHESFLS